MYVVFIMYLLAVMCMRQLIWSIYVFVEHLPDTCIASRKLLVWVYP
jgi:hypothetical protein